MKQIFDFLRKISGGSLTQKQVDAADKLIATAYDDVTEMFGIAIDVMSTSPSGVDLICNFEGKRLVAYDDGVGVWTIGFGTIKYPNGVRVKRGDKCTEAQAEQYLRNDLIKFENAVNRLVKVPLNQNQFDALISFTYNLGETNLNNSTMLKKLNTKDYKGAAAEFLKWNQAGGRVLNGLVKRRKSEMELFLK